VEQNEQFPAPASQNVEAKGDGEVGYGRPPQAHQFKAGQSGNPKGRPKGTKNEATILREILDETKLPLREGGRQRKITVREGILRKVTEDALKGNTKSASFLLNRYGLMVSGEVGHQATSEEDQDILEAFRDSVLTRHGRKP
jgi:hypothetical protein